MVEAGSMFASSVASWWLKMIGIALNISVRSFISCYLELKTLEF